MGTKMKNAPVYFTIAQVRFNPILALESYAPQIQEHLRKQGYPDAQKGLLATVNLTLSAPTEASVPQMPIAQTTRFSFYNMERTSGFILDQGALSYQTTEYEVFEKFSFEFLKGLETVHEAVDKGLAYSDRIGVRYLDAVFPMAEEPLANYLSESVLGLVGKHDGKLIHSFSETLVKINDLNILTRVIIQEGKVGFPPDLLAIPLTLSNRFKKLEGPHAILDIDGSIEIREAFNPKNVRERLIAIHDEITKAFRCVITEKALKAWE